MIEFTKPARVDSSADARQDIETRVFSPTTYTAAEERPKLPGHDGRTRTQKRRQSESGGAAANPGKRSKKNSENGPI